MVSSCGGAHASITTRDRSPTDDRCGEEATPSRDARRPGVPTRSLKGTLPRRVADLTSFLKRDGLHRRPVRVSWPA